MKINKIRKQRDGSFLLAIFNLGYGGRGEKFAFTSENEPLSHRIQGNRHEPPVGKFSD